MNNLPSSQRIDKWLWHARLAKSRSIAQKMVTSGKVRVDKLKVTSASKVVQIEDVITLARERDVKIIKVIGIPLRRGPFSEAQQFYEDLTPVIEVKAKVKAEFDKNAKIQSQGRPSKHQRKELLKLKRYSTSDQD